MMRHKAISPALFVILVLSVVTCAIYWPIRTFDFVNYDDNIYVYDNIHVKTGLTLENIIWAFTKPHASNWHPITWISHMVDVDLYGLKPGGHHLTSLFIHIVNSLLLFYLLYLLTGALLPSVVVAFLFAVHPLHVESVAWISERKDVLSTFFLLLAIGAYYYYTQHSNVKRYVLLLIFFSLGLMAKPMLVTFPLLLILLDYWPLHRFPRCNTTVPIHSVSDKKLRQPLLSNIFLLAEKIPLLLLSIASGIVTIIVQKSDHAVKVIAFDERIINTFVSYVSYIFSMIIPRNLCILYPYNHNIPHYIAIFSILFFLVLAIVLVRNGRKYPWLAVGWLWYVISLLPVIGLIQVGFQQKADRYTYIPSIGLFLIFAWGMEMLFDRFPKVKKTGIAVIGMILVVLSMNAREQVGYWKDSITLNRHALDCTRDNYIVHVNLGSALDTRGRSEEALEHYKESLRIKPDFFAAALNSGRIYLKKGDINRALFYFRLAVQSDSSDVVGLNCLGKTYAQTGDLFSAILYFKKALYLKPDFIDVLMQLGFIMHERDSLQKAVDYFSEVIRLQPESWIPYYYTAVCLSKKGDFQGAETRFREAIHLCNDSSFAPYFGMGVLQFNHGDPESAKKSFTRAILLAPQFPHSYCNRAFVHAQLNNLDSAISDYRRALKVKPDFPTAHAQLAEVFRKKEMHDSALYYQKTLKPADSALKKTLIAPPFQRPD